MKIWNKIRNDKDEEKENSRFRLDSNTDDENRARYSDQ